MSVPVGKNCPHVYIQHDEAGPCGVGKRICKITNQSARLRYAGNDRAASRNNLIASWA
jgi:hypothetical protein